MDVYKETETCRLQTSLSRSRQHFQLTSRPRTSRGRHYASSRNLDVSLFSGVKTVDQGLSTAATSAQLDLLRTYSPTVLTCKTLRFG